MQVLGCSALVCKLVNDNEFIRAITKIDASVDLSDETNPSVAKLLKCRVAVMPPILSHRFVTEPAAKTKAGWKFPSPSMESINGSITALSTALLRVYSANLQSVDLVGDYYATIVPGAVSRAAVSPTNNFYAQWASADDPDGPWVDRVVGGTTGKARADVWRWLRTEMRLSEKAEAGKALAKAILLKEDGSPQAELEEQIEVTEPDPKDATKTVTTKKSVAYYPRLPVVTTHVAMTAISKKGEIDLLRPLTAVEIPYWEKFQKDTFPSRKKGKKVVATMGNTLTKLTPGGLALVEEIEKTSPHLAERMRQWLRGFSDERVQRAAVKLANASFDELFIQESQDSDDESDADASDDDE